MPHPASLPFFRYSATVLPKMDTDIEHYNHYKISIILTNGMSCVYQDKIYRLTRGDVILFHPSELHFGRVLREGVHRYVDLFIPTDFADALTQEHAWLRALLNNSLEKKVHRISPSEHDRGALITLTERLAAAYQTTDESALIGAYSDMLQIIGICCRLYRVPESASDGTGTPAILRAALRYMTEHYAEIQSTVEIAEKVGCSMTYLARLFRSYTGDTVLSYLTAYRLRQAKQQLMSGASVTDACYRSGFGDCSHFIKVFKKHEGITPLVYQKQCQTGR